MSHPPARTDVACRNCGAQAPLKFCPGCGQETTLHPPTLGEFLHEFVGHYVALEGELWRTLRLLLARPGRLTREYLAGRRRRYVLPLRLYLTCSFLFFLVLKLAPDTNHVVVMSVDGHRVQTSDKILHAAASAPSLAASGVHGPAFEVLRFVDCGGAGMRACGRLEAFANELGARLGDHPDEVFRHLYPHILGLAPYAVFLLLPVFAGLMMLAYRNRRMTYGEHVVFSLHVHAFWFLASLVIAILPESLASLVQLVIPVYGTWAMHEAYGGRWGPTLLRALLVTLVYGAVLLLGTSVLFVGVLLGG